MNPLSRDQINKRLKNLDGWHFDGDAIRKEWQFKDFQEALKFINRIGALAENHDHHPELYNVYNKVSLRFNTHSVGGITDKDFNIATEIDEL